MLDDLDSHTLMRIAAALESIAESLSVLVEPPPKKPINGDDEEFEK